MMCEPDVPPRLLQNHLPVAVHLTTDSGSCTPQYAHACAGSAAQSYGRSASSSSGSSGSSGSAVSAAGAAGGAAAGGAASAAAAATPPASASASAAASHTPVSIPVKRVRSARVRSLTQDRADA
jgi:hypothetical protein